MFQASVGIVVIVGEILYFIGFTRTFNNHLMGDSKSKISRHLTRVGL